MIHLWEPTQAGKWVVEKTPYSGHTASVEDLQVCLLIYVGGDFELVNFNLARPANPVLSLSMWTEISC
jgi:hypothetical protein